MGISIMGGTQSYSNLYSAASTGQQPPKKPTIDTDGSGSISKDELTSFISDIQSKSSSSADSTESIDAEEIFSNLDSDGDGEISSEEEKSLKDYLPKPQGMPNMSQAGGPPPQGAGGPPPSMMSMADTNSDSSIDEDELTSLLSDISDKTGTELDSKEVFSALDTDEDGTISEEEAEGLKAYLPEPPEMPQMNAQMQAQLQSAYASSSTISSVGSSLNYVS